MSGVREHGTEWVGPSPGLDGYGRLVASIAHEFTNILTIVISKADLLADGLPREASDLHEDLQDLRRAARRGADLTDRMLSSARRRRLAPEVVDLTRLTRGLGPTLGRLLPPSVELEMPPAEKDPALVQADAGSLHQILLDLVSNARDAMPGGGRVSIALERTPSSGSDGARHALIVSDTGGGIPPEIQARVFEPFFTTKHAGSSAGLGLSSVVGLVEQQGGSVSLRSAPGTGTAVRVELPSVVAPRPGPDAAAEAGGAAQGGTRPVVLVAEDEEVIRRAARRVLEQHGFRVIQAGDGAEALRLLSEPEPQVDLVLTDIVMPRLDGIALFHAARGRRPVLPFLFMSGYQNEEALQPLGIDPERAFLPKPWSVPELLAAVRRSLPAAIREPAEAAP